MNPWTFCPIQVAVLFLEMQPYPLPSEVQDRLSTTDELKMDRMLFRAGLRATRDVLRPRRDPAIAVPRRFWWFRTGAGAAYQASWSRYRQILCIVLLASFLPRAFLSTRHWRRYTLLWLVFVYYAPFHLSFHVQTRFRWKIGPCLLVFAAIAVSLPLEKVGRWQDKLPDCDEYDGREKRRLPGPHKRRG